MVKENAAMLKKAVTQKKVVIRIKKKASAAVKENVVAKVSAVVKENVVGNILKIC